MCAKNFLMLLLLAAVLPAAGFQKEDVLYSVKVELGEEVGAAGADALNEADLGGEEFAGGLVR